MHKGCFSSFRGAFFTLACVSAATAQTVDFSNIKNFATPADRRVYNVDGQNPLVGTNFQARLLYGADASNLQPASYTNPARFRNVPPTDPLAGTWSGSLRTLTGFASGDTVYLVVQVWHAGPDAAPGVPGRTFEEARNSGGLWMQSVPFTYVIPTNGAASSAFYMENFRGIFLLDCPPPGPISILETNGQIQLSFNQYQPVEVSDDLIGWTALGWQYSPYIDTNAPALSKRFYRLHCSGAYSPNYVGFYRINFAPGYTFIANHLRLPDPRVVQIFPSPPNGTAVFPFNQRTGGYISITYLGDWEGDDLDMTLAPGEGVILRTETPFGKTFVGEVILNSTNRLDAGFNLRSSMVPQSLPLTGNPGLNFPVAEGDEIYQFNPATGGYRANSFLGGAWEGDNEGLAPTPALGECFFLNKRTPASWIRQIGPPHFP